MNRTGLIAALAVAAVAGLLFGIFPGLDLRVARYFHDYIDASQNAFAWRIYPPLMAARNTGIWAGFILVAPAVAAIIVKLALPRRKMFISGRGAVFLIATLALGPGLLVNVLLKEYWGRPRPIDVTEFGGQQQFVPWWSTKGECQSNCSFVSGDV
jgi:lipid A 4'-phosphatase